MLFDDDANWNAVKGDELAGFIAQVGTVDGKHRTSPETTSVSWRSLSFYEQVVLIRVRDRTWVPENLSVYYLANQGTLTRLDGTSPPIHQTNADAPIRLSDDNVMEYLHFFCFFVRGEDGPFLVAESMDTHGMPRTMDDTTRRVIEGTIRPATFEGKNAEGFWLCDAIVFYSNALFFSNFAIQPTGMIEMTDDDPLAQDLPVRVDCPIA
jgi:hypothetical protein